MKTRSKNIKRIVLLLLMLALATWVATRWNVWFGNPDELAVQPLKAPGHVMLTFGDESEMSRNVSWQCDTVLQPSRLELVCLDTNDRHTLAQRDVDTTRLCLIALGLVYKGILQ